MAHFRNILPLSTWPSYLLWHYAQRKPFRCRLLGGPKVSIRPKPSHDYQTIFEIFFERIYDCDLDPGSVRRIVDLGGNVGYSCLFWCEKFPNASVLTFEPHPAHCRLLEWHVDRNGYADRVELVAAAAGVREGVANLSDEDDGSAIVQDKQAGTIEVPVVDIFQAVPNAPIDVLKMDIEGSEYAILEDTRFDALAARTKCLLLEWHARGNQAEALCRERLAGLGFSVESGRNCSVGSGRNSYDQCGMLYCTRT
jgi:FkbM family methyltransferase